MITSIQAALDRHRNAVPVAMVAVLVGLLLMVAGCRDDNPPPRTGPKITFTMGAVTEDSPGFNCLTMGDHRCGSVYHRYPVRELAALDGCLMDYRDGTPVVCDDGRTYFQGALYQDGTYVAEQGLRGWIPVADSEWRDVGSEELWPQLPPRSLVQCLISTDAIVYVVCRDGLVYRQGSR